VKDKGDIVRLKAQVMAFGGSAKARNLEDPGDPASYFVTLCAPGDVVQARVLERKDRYARAEALSILEPSPHRTTPRCNVFGKCGGCHWQHLDYAEQLVQKADVLGFTISRALDEIPAVEPALASPDPYGYRHRATFKARRKGSTLEIGFFAQRSRRIVEIDACPILAPAIRELPGMLRDLPRDLDPAPEGIFEIEAACGDTDDAVALLARPVEDKPTKKNQGRFLELDGGRFRQAEPERDLYYTASGETIGFSLHGCWSSTAGSATSPLPRPVSAAR